MIPRHSLRRHSLVWLSRPPVSDQSPDIAQAWFESGHPFMVCRTRPGEDLSLGFCLPLPLSKKSDDPRSPARIAAESKHADIQHIARPPDFHLVEDPRQDSKWHWLPANDPLKTSGGMPDIFLPPDGCTLRLIGSRMWQFLTGVRYTSERSDMDIVMDIAHCGLMDEAAAFLIKANDLSPWKLDGEISIPDLGEVHWKEWLSPANPVLVKSLEVVELRSREWIYQHHKTQVELP